MPALRAEQQQALARAYAQLHPSDVIEIRFVPGEGTSVSVSGERVLTDRGFELMAVFLNIWMVQTPVSEEIKSALLAGLEGS